MRNIILKFGTLAVATAILLQLSKYSIFTKGWHEELIIGTMAIFFIALGLWINHHLSARKNTHEEQSTNSNIDSSKVASLGISSREMDVLKEIAMGKSNQEIADSLYISESTVKTHVSSLLLKLDAKRRTEAIIKARAYKLIS